MSSTLYLNLIEPFTCVNPAKSIQILMSIRGNFRYDTQKIFDVFSLIDFSVPNTK